jgi:hypothetical protein
MAVATDEAFVIGTVSMGVWCQIIGVRDDLTGDGVFTVGVDGEGTFEEW